LAPAPGNTTVDALQEGLPDDATSLTTIEVGTPGVSVLLIMSLRAESDMSAFGVTLQEQQEINCSSGENVYTFAHRLPFCVGKVSVELSPVLVRLITASPKSVKGSTK